tara:strand:- start:190 stop:576 length:387 start_codon:yes stop_codon:yes gene_type:complete
LAAAAMQVRVGVRGLAGSVLNKSAAGLKPRIEAGIAVLIVDPFLTGIGHAMFTSFLLSNLALKVGVPNLKMRLLRIFTDGQFRRYRSVLNQNVRCFFGPAPIRRVDLARSFSGMPVSGCYNVDLFEGA